MENDNIMGDRYFIKEEEELFVITPQCLLYETLKDYGIEVGPWLPKMWEHIINDFMDGMCKAGHIEKG